MFELENENAPATLAETTSVENDTKEVENAKEVEESVEFTDTDETKGVETENVEPKEKAEFNQNRINAQRRIEAKKMREEAEKKVQREAYVKGLTTANNGKNPFTNKAMVDEIDIKEYETMLEMQSKGLDPIEDYADYVKSKQREEIKQRETEHNQEIEAKNNMDADFNSFTQKYGEETLNKISNDNDFIEFATGMFGKVPLDYIYEKFIAVQARIEAKAKEQLLEKDARRISSTGGYKSQSETSQSLDFSKMTAEEFKAYKKSLNLN